MCRTERSHLVSCQEDEVDALDFQEVHHLFPSNYAVSRVPGSRPLSPGTFYGTKLETHTGRPFTCSCENCTLGEFIHRGRLPNLADGCGRGLGGGSHQAKRYGGPVCVSPRLRRLSLISRVCCHSPESLLEAVMLRVVPRPPGRVVH